MKICAYCTTKNRDEAIFCSHCRRPLQTSPTRIVLSSGTILVWLLVVVVLIGVGSYLLSSGPFPATAATQTGTPVGGSVPTQVVEPVAILVCVDDSTRIRRGPGTHYETTGGLPSGTCLTVLGRNEDASWVYIISDDDLTGWVAATALTGITELSRVSVRDDFAMVNPAQPTLTSAEIANGAKLYLTSVAATNYPLAPLSEYVEPCFEAVNRIGGQISCKMERAICDYLPEVEGSPTVCIDRPAPDYTFALVALGNDWSKYDGQCLIVEGYLEIDHGVLLIEALRSDQVSACE